VDPGKAKPIAGSRLAMEVAGIQGGVGELMTHMGEVDSQILEQRLYRRRGGRGVRRVEGFSDKFG